MRMSGRVGGGQWMGNLWQKNRFPSLKIGMRRLSLQIFYLFIFVYFFCCFFFGGATGVKSVLFQQRENQGNNAKYIDMTTDSRGSNLPASSSGWPIAQFAKTLYLVITYFMSLHKSWMHLLISLHKSWIILSGLLPAQRSKQDFNNQCLRPQIDRLNICLYSYVNSYGLKRS